MEELEAELELLAAMYSPDELSVKAGEVTTIEVLLRPQAGDAHNQRLSLIHI